MDHCYELVPCSRNTKPSAPSATEKFELCPRILTEQGQACRVWADNNKMEADNLSRKFCRNINELNSPHVALDVCACINREQDDSYLNLRPDKKGSSIDACWWRPCSEPDKYLVTSEFEDIQCPKRVCKTVSRKLKKRVLDAPLVICQATPDTLWSEYSGWIIGTSIAIVILVVIICIIIVIRRRKKHSLK